MSIKRAGQDRFLYPFVHMFLAKSKMIDFWQTPNRLVVNM